MSLCGGGWRRRKPVRRLTLLLVLVACAGVSLAQDKPNFLVIWGDDIGIYNISAYNDGAMGYRTPNIDRIAQEGAALVGVELGHDGALAQYRDEAALAQLEGESQVFAHTAARSSAVIAIRSAAPSRTWARWAA